MILQSYVVGRIQANCYVVGDEESREVLVIDPGDDAARLLDQFEQHDFRVVAVLATHHHLDHSGGIHELLEALPAAEFLMHRLDYPQIAPQAPAAQGWYGHAVTPPREPDRYLEHGDTVQAGRHSFTALHCPGHTSGSLCFHGEGMVFTGDVLFADHRSVGRTDFPGGDARTLIESIREHLMTLPDETTVYPGHNQATTVGNERTRNPYVVNPRAALGLDID